MKMWRSLFALTACSTAGPSLAQITHMEGGPRVNQLNLHNGVTPIAQDIAWLHWMMLIICTIIFIGVFGVMFYSIIRHRKSKGAIAARFHEHLGVEVAWTIIPFLIVIGMALPATKTVVAMKDTSSADLTVKVTGYQWKWGYEYLDGPATGVKFLSNLSTPRAQIEGREPIGPNYLMEVDKPLVVPVNKKVRVMLTAEDVIHSWMVPEFGVKQDAIPGFLRDTWFRADKVGTYRGQCAELCGKDHAYMPIVVQVMAQEDYDKWAQEQNDLMTAQADDPNKEWTKDELTERGKQIFAQNCVACHQANGKGMPGTFPALDGDTKFVLAPKKGQIDTVLNGHPGTAMAAFRNQLTDVQIAAVITYTRNAWGNAGKGPDPVVMPADVKEQR
ncbi:cytochrome c oxidase subunit II [Alcaligenes faecalis]|jgi:cytochrome c oxidase subunit 2|uniref:Cytochrome c oxidase subunit 2 n=1 Tax=Alcaligenes faecalis TaxID=511 RepID=A0A2U2BJG3_ALCFA|nr:cytochrome c oxidase subunit II [Alcaligenes faecalis]KAA1286054.1 cytochrome c oxidase subunit II [Alcaligenes faecalis]PWE14106.1 cytochrome c oxidase subunit II [Alcaligenes faecalis]USP47784.1 cytochrome c oxidase subunit II [Alcaligenes faecalis]WHQ42509.1 cytochrome c oxidase subunit II [Alcaligenes faecalis]